MFDFLGPYWAIFAVGVVFKNALGSTNVVKQLLFTMIPSFLTFEFDLLLGLFLTFWGPNGIFFWAWVWFKNCSWVSSSS